MTEILLLAILITLLGWWVPIFWIIGLVLIFVFAAAIATEYEASQNTSSEYCERNCGIIPMKEREWSAERAWYLKQKKEV